LTDKDGDIWTPPTFNIMSYSRRELRVLYSNSQMAIMYNYIYGRNGSTVSGFKLHYNNDFVDVYEPDGIRRDLAVVDDFGLRNPFNISNELTSGIKQHRGLHRDIHGNRGASNDYSYCDED
jgi:hypothetical protein